MSEEEKIVLLVEGERNVLERVLDIFENNAPAGISHIHVDLTAAKELIAFLSVNEEIGKIYGVLLCGLLPHGGTGLMQLLREKEYSGPIIGIAEGGREQMKLLEMGCAALLDKHSEVNPNSIFRELQAGWSR